MDDFSEYLMPKNNYNNHFGKYWFERQLDIQGSEVTIKGKVVKGIIENTGFNRINVFMQLIKKILVDTEVDISSGDMIKYENNTYLVTSEVENLGYYKRSRIQKTNDILKFSDKNKIYEYPCVLVSKTLYSDGLDERTQIQSKDDLVGIWVNTNEHTSTLREGNCIIFKTKYDKYHKFKITLVDDFTIEGVSMFIASSSQIDTQRDNLDLCIADYYNNKDDEITELGSVVIEGKSSIVRNNTNEYFINSNDEWEFSVSDDKLATIKKIDKNKIQLITGSSTGELELIASNKKETVTLKIQIRGRI